MPGYESIGQNCDNANPTARNRARFRGGQSSEGVVWLFLHLSARAISTKVEEVCDARCALVEGSIKSIKNACHKLSDDGRPRSWTAYTGRKTRTSICISHGLYRLSLGGESLYCW